MGKNYKAIAESYDKKVQKEEERSESRYIPENKKFTHGQLSELQELTGYYWLKAGNRKKGIKFYRNSIKNAYTDAEKKNIRKRFKRGIPPRRENEKGLGKLVVSSILAIACFLGALFFLSFNLTGNVVGELTYEGSNLVSLSLFFLGLVFAFFYFKNKK